jgi:MFS family permease
LVQPPETWKSRLAEPVISPPVPVVPETSPLAKLREIGWVVRSRPRLQAIFLIYMITQFAGEGVALSTITLLFMTRFPEGLSTGSLVIGIASLSGASIAFRYLLSSVFSPLFGSLSDGRRGRTPLILLSLLLGVASFIVLAFATSIFTTLLGLLINAASGGAAISTLAAQLGDETRGAKDSIVLGFYASSGDFGSALGALSSLLLLPLLNLLWIYLFCSVLFVTGFFMGLKGFRKKETITS